MSETTPVPQSYAPATAKTNTLAIISLVTSILWGTALVGVITGHIALSQIKRTGESGRGLALAGVIIGYVGIGSALLGIVLWVGLIAVAASAGYPSLL
jgi:hypothetical protein